MDIIGKIYKDYFLKDIKLDGNSHQIHDFEIGGIGNLITNKNLLAKVNKEIKLNFYLLGDSISLEKISSRTSNFHNVFKINQNSHIPNALIIEQGNKRTSYVLNDSVTKLDVIKKQSDNCIIYYGDKIKLGCNVKYEKIYIDTAGNSYDDLFFDYSKNSKNIIISISEEYLTNDLMNFYLRINKAIIISHNPKSTKIITLKGSETINNDYFTEKKIDKITGLGDNFFLLIATYLESTTSKKIKDAIKYAHQELYFLISNS